MSQRNDIPEGFQEIVPLSFKKDGLDISAVLGLAEYALNARAAAEPNLARAGRIALDRIEQKFYDAKWLFKPEATPGEDLGNDSYHIFGPDQ